jgi:integrase/recombinase XerC
MYTTPVHRLLTEIVEGSPSAATEEHIDALFEDLKPRAAVRVGYTRGLRSFFGWCHRRGHISSNPAAFLESRKQAYRAPIALEEDELIRYMIAAAWRDPRRAWSLMLMFSIGCRRTELTAIRPSDVQGSNLVLRRTKGDRPRVVALNELAVTAIEELRPWSTPTSVIGDVVPQTVTE